MDPTGQRIGAFEIVRLLGAGAMGMVYLAQDNVLRREVALKLITKGSAEADRELQERFLREARAAARLIHPNVVQIFQIGETSRHRFIAMEYVEGASLRQVARQNRGRLPALFAMEKMREAADALRLAASMGVCHRDIKPANLLLNSAGTLKITDFGLAAQVDPNGMVGPVMAQVEGTPFYMGPEQWAGALPSPAADIYSLGCTFYHLLTGSRPYAAKDFYGCMQEHCNSPVPDARVLVPDMDPALAELLKSCMAKQPLERPTAKELVQKLDELLYNWRNSAQPEAALPVVVGAPPPMGPAPGSTMGPSTNPGSRSFPGSQSSWPRGASASSRSSRPGSGTLDSSAWEIEVVDQSSYHSYFAFKDYPFSDIRLPAFFWEGGCYGSALRALGSQIRVGQRVNMVVGPSGSGKTFLCEMLQHRVPGASVFLIEPQLLFGAQLFLSLCRQAGLQVNTNSSQRSLMESFLAHVLPDRPEATAVIVVDGVDQDDQALLAELDRIFQSSPRRRFSLVLVGTERLHEELARRNAPPSLLAAAPVALQPMTQQEMAEYISFRVRTAGGGEGFALDTASRQLMHLRSGGLPRLVSVFCHNMLTLTMLRQERQPRLDTLRLAVKSKSYLSPEAARSLLLAG